MYKFINKCYEVYIISKKSRLIFQNRILAELMVGFDSKILHLILNCNSLIVKVTLFLAAVATFEFSFLKKTF